MEMYKVIKRDGKIAEFDIGKISAAIEKAFIAQEKQYHSSIIDLLALKTTADFEPKIKDGTHRGRGHSGQRGGGPVQAGYADVAKAYILYRKQREKVRNLKATFWTTRDRGQLSERRWTGA
jgi:anaerobic ribonucleoside-triphosphate reductase